MLLLIHCFMYLPLFVGVLCWSLFCYALLCVLSSFAIILKKKRELIALRLLSCGCLATVYVLLLFLTVSWVGLQCVNVLFPDHTHFLSWLDGPREYVFSFLQTGVYKLFKYYETHTNLPRYD